MSRRVWIALLFCAGCGGGSGPTSVIPCDLEQRCPGALQCDVAKNTCIDLNPPTTCEAPKSTCGADCVDVSSSTKHCGGCNRPCAGNCAGGTCVITSTCAFCPAGVPCVNGQCDCEGRGSFCTAACFDTTQSKISCGGCLAFCQGSGQGCKAGVCSCPPGKQLCASSCISTDADPKNCGTCGNMCTPTQKCEAGSCVAACTRNLTNACGDGKCWDLTTDGAHCGATCKNCSTDRHCDAGSCACPPGTTVCGSNCYDVARDPLHCGTCTKSCNRFEVCNAGTCACLPGMTTCGTECTDLQTDVRNCGACAAACPAGQTCLAGHCAASCPAPAMACDAGCVDPQRSVQHCGGCGKPCSAGSQCLDGMCSKISPARGCNACPCDDCTFARGWLCCGAAGNASCVDAYRCP